MDKSRLGGIFICIVTVVAAILFVWGVVAKEYWAIAIPVAIGFLGVLSLGFWIGWTMIVTEVEPETVTPKPHDTPRNAPESVEKS